MNKKLTLAVLLLGATYVSADTYIGVNVGYGLGTNTVSVGSEEADIDNDYTNLSLILGTGDDGGFKFQGRLNIISLDEAIYDDSHDTLFEIGIDGIKEWEVSPTLYPYIKAGLASGFIGTDDTYYDSSIAMEFSLNAGAGLSFKVNDQLDIIGGVDYVFRKYQDVDVGYYTLSITGSSFEPYIGMRYSF